MVDVVFADLNLLAPTTDEIDRVKKNLILMEKLWNVVGLPWTPKVHLLFRHCVNDMKRFGGLGDKVEQSIEKRHQLQVLMSIRLRTIKDVNARLVRQYEYEWRSSHPMVRRIISKVEAPLRVRKHTPTLTLKQENSNKRFKAKSLRRFEVARDTDNFVLDLCEVVLCNENLTDENGLNTNQQNNEPNVDSTVANEI